MYQPRDSYRCRNTDRLMFIERWAAITALGKHFQVPEPGALIEGIGQLATVAPEMSLDESRAIQRH